MKFTPTLFFFIITFSAVGQGIVGKWKTIDDETTEPKSIVEIVEKNGKYYGKIIKLFRAPGEDPDPICEECDLDDDRYQKKIIGMEILKDMMKSGTEYSEGNILDPNNGKIYSCKIWLEGKNLKLRGYWGPFFRTQTWLPGL
ncbi:MAG: DUF2147 domain-containing protein [Cyclobacteriaceae bacterium]